MAVPTVVVPLLAIAAAACPQPPPVKALVIAGAEPLSVETDLRLASYVRLQRKRTMLSCTRLTASTLVKLLTPLALRSATKRMIYALGRPISR